MIDSWAYGGRDGTKFVARPITSRPVVYSTLKDDLIRLAQETDIEESDKIMNRYFKVHDSYYTYKITVDIHITPPDYMYWVLNSAIGHFELGNKTLFGGRYKRRTKKNRKNSYK